MTVFAPDRPGHNRLAFSETETQERIAEQMAEPAAARRERGNRGLGR
jgi:hypothetical protein